MSWKDLLRGFGHGRPPRSTPVPTVHSPGAVASSDEIFRQYLQEEVAKGVEFKEGETIQFGWMWFKIAMENDSPLIVAPRTGVMPMEFISDCSDALNTIVRQRYICDSFETIMEPCHACQSAIVIKDLNTCEEIFMNRTDEADGHASGWFFGARDTKLDANCADDLELRSLWQIACDVPLSTNFFLLPLGWQVVFKERPVVLNEYEPVTALKGSFYQANYGQG